MLILRLLLTAIRVLLGMILLATVKVNISHLHISPKERLKSGLRNFDTSLID